MIPTTLVAGARPAAREAAIAASLEPGVKTVVILEGLADPAGVLGGTPANVVRIGAACPCCTGNLILRVTLTRLLRTPPQRLFIAIADPAHLAALRQMLQQPPYEKLLLITKDLPV